MRPRRAVLWGEMGLLGIALVAAALLIAGYVWFVSRRTQTYATQAIFEAPIDAVWRLHDIRPGQADWIPSLSSCDWVDEAAGDMSLRYENGTEMRYRLIERAPPTRLFTEARMKIAPDAPFGDLYRTASELVALPDGRTLARSRMEVQKDSDGSMLLVRLGYPWIMPIWNATVRRALAKAGEVGSGKAAPKTSALLLQVGLVAATILWLGWLLGPAAGLGVLVMLVVHEYGHVWSMRRHGHKTARFYLVPFFGGIAIGSRPFASEAEAVEIFLMGPLFGLFPSLVSMALYGLTGDPFWASLAGFLAICNGLNLAPLPPLDGGRVVLSLMRPLGERAWYAGAGLLTLAGGAVAAYFQLSGLLFVVVLGALIWATSRGPDPSTRPLARAGLLAAWGGYVALILIHLALAISAFDAGGPIGALKAGPAFLSGDDGA